MQSTVSGQAPFPQARFAAITQMAVFEAVNSIQKDYLRSPSAAIWKLKAELSPRPVENDKISNAPVGGFNRLVCRFRRRFQPTSSTERRPLRPGRGPEFFRARSRSVRSGQGAALSADGQIVPGSGDALNGIITPGSRNGLSLSDGLEQPANQTFGPRLGFAYSLTPQTVIRGGYSINYFRGAGTNVGRKQNPPFSNSANIQNPPACQSDRGPQSHLPGQSQFKGTATPPPTGAELELQYPAAAQRQCQFRDRLCRHAGFVPAARYPN